MSSYMFVGIINSKKTFIWVELLANLVIKWWYLTILNMQNNGSSIWWCETFILALRRDDEALRYQHQPSNQPCYRPGEVRKCNVYSGGEEKEATGLFHKLAHSNFSTSWGARKTMLINMMLILFYYLWQVRMMQKLHIYTRTWKDNHSSEMWIIMHSD